MNTDEKDQKKAAKSDYRAVLRLFRTISLLDVQSLVCTTTHTKTKVEELVARVVVATARQGTIARAVVITTTTADAVGARRVAARVSYCI